MVTMGRHGLPLQLWLLTELQLVHTAASAGSQWRFLDANCVAEAVVVCGFPEHAASPTVVITSLLLFPLNELLTAWIE